MQITTCMKAIVAALVAGLTTLSQAMIDGTITAQDGVTAAVAFLVALAAVWAVPNRSSSSP